MFNHKEYNKIYYQNNKEKIKKESAQYRKKNREKIVEYLRRYYQDNKEYFKKYSKKYREENKEAKIERDKKYRENHKEYYKDYSEKYYQKNKKKINDKNKLYRENHKDEWKQYYKEWTIKNKESILRQKKEWVINNRDKVLVYKNKSYEKNKDKAREYRIKNKDRINIWRKKQRENNVNFILNDRVGTMIRNSLKKNKNGKHWEALVGYTKQDLIKRLKQTIPEGYVWQDFLEAKLQIDHIIPQSIFEFTSYNDIDFKRCWALENLRLLPAKENNQKNNKLIKSFQPILKLYI